MLATGCWLLGIVGCWCGLWFRILGLHLNFAVVGSWFSGGGVVVSAVVGVGVFGIVMVTWVGVGLGSG